ncbi:hypothetical protein COL516b_000425 [Colletotrichum fioriniae]|nr:uncharacterized protein COL516b_000425 [Colletotrichum fioriniae]KAJ0313486.1 hypothetical protein COL516b_000425 [Colletotrichum fioriniae]
MTNPQTPSTDAGAGANILTPNINVSNLKPITKIRLLPSKPILTPPTTTGTTGTSTTPSLSPSPKPKAIKLKLKASSSSSSVFATSRRRKLHRQEDVASSRQSSEPSTLVYPAAAAAAASPATTGTEVTTTTEAITEATAPVTTYTSPYTSLYTTTPRVDHWLNQQVALHAARGSPFSSFSVSASLGNKKKPRILISTRNLTWIKASNGVWVKVPLASWKERQYQGCVEDESSE